MTCRKKVMDNFGASQKKKFMDKISLRKRIIWAANYEEDGKNYRFRNSR
jgi:hypothetical protein